MAKCGGASDVREPSDDTHQICKTIRPAVEKHTNKKYDSFDAVSTRTQVVAGINHFIKVKVSPDEFIHLRVYKNLKQELNLHGVLTGKKQEDALEYFDQNLN